jgi:arylsulfatase A-like enzyme
VRQGTRERVRGRSAATWSGLGPAAALAVGTLTAALAAAGCRSPVSKAGQATPPPVPTAGNGVNVLLVTIDTLRADHLGAYGYFRDTSPHLDALARRGTLFEQAYTYWPKTRGSFVAIMTGRLASQSGYGKSHPQLLDFNPTLASTLAAAGYQTAAVVDNPNVARGFGYAKGFARYRETWEETSLGSEMARARAITADGVRFLSAARPGRPFLLWLHYVNPHAPYQPPPPFDTAFLDAAAARGPRLRPVDGFHGGVSKHWAIAGKTLGWYRAQYDGEIAAVDAEVGRVLAALWASPVRDRTLVIVTSDHGESLGEHDYYFDHGEDLFDPSLRIPLLVAGPGVRAGQRTDLLASTLDLLPTVLDAAKVSYPPDLAGESLLPALRGQRQTARPRLQGQNDRNLLGAWDHRFKIVAVPLEDGARYALYDRQRDPGETRDVSRVLADRMRVERGELEAFRARIDAQYARTRRLLEGRPAASPPSAVACEQLKALGYVQQGCP